MGRQFTISQAVLARDDRKSKVRVLSKKTLAAKAKKRALKSRKNIYDSEKMTLADAIAVLRVRVSPDTIDRLANYNTRSNYSP